MHVSYRHGLSRFGVRLAGLLAAAAGLSAQDYSPPAGYYSKAEGLLGDPLRVALHDIIDNHTNLGYDAMGFAPRVLDADPDVSGNIILQYSGASVAGHLFNTAWNREHTWPQSFGADADLKPGADFHHLFPANPGVNSTRSNLIFDWTDPNDYKTVPDAPGSSYDSNSFEPRDADKGRVARAMLYMDLRYETSDGYGDFNLGESANQTAKRMAKLSTLLQWNRMFPPDERERRRNHLIHTGFQFSTFTYKQNNRNPFVDFPDLGDVLFTSADRIAWGTWRWSNFSMDELSAGTITGVYDDPDGDRLDNLIEYSANLDPRTFGRPGLLSAFRFSGFYIQLRYTRQKNAHLDGFEYSIERSYTPLREESWQVLGPADINSTSVSASGAAELVTVSLPDDPKPVFFRLRVKWTNGPTVSESAFDPVRTYDETGSIFVYDRKAGSTGWRESSWFGFVHDGGFPWVYQYEHKYLYLQATRDDSVWAYDTSIGWFFTNSALYPYLYHVQSARWLYFQVGSLSPDRWFIDSNGQWVNESDL